MRRHAQMLVATTAVFVFCVLAGPSPQAGGRSVISAGQDNPIEMSEESIAAGRRTYGRFCRSCHGLGADGSGMTAPPDSMPANLVDDEWDHGSTDGEIFTVIKEGVGPKFDMNAWEGRITDDEIWQVINFLRDLASK